MACRNSLKATCLFCTVTCDYMYSVGECGILIKLSGSGDDGECSSLGQDELTVDFIVGNLLKVSNSKWNDQIDLENGLALNESRLIPICNSCERIIQKCHKSQCQINQLTNELESGRQELMKQVVLSSSKSVDDLGPISFWKRVRKEAGSSFKLIAVEFPERNAETQENVGSQSVAEDQSKIVSTNSSVLTQSSMLNAEVQSLSPPRTPNVEARIASSLPRTPRVIVDEIEEHFSTTPIRSLSSSPSTPIPQPRSSSLSPSSSSSSSSSSSLTSDTDTSEDDDDDNQARAITHNQAESTDDDDVLILPTPVKPAPEVITISEDSDDDDNSDNDDTQSSDSGRCPQSQSTNVVPLPIKRKLKKSELTGKRFTVQFKKSYKDVRVFKCPECCAFFKVPLPFRAHVLAHKKRYGYSNCDICGWRLINGKVYLHQERAHTPSR